LGWDGIFLTVYLNVSASVLEVVVAVVDDFVGLGVTEDAGVDALEDVEVDAGTGTTLIFRSPAFLDFFS
jgi:hypothetical protein